MEMGVQLLPFKVKKGVMLKHRMTETETDDGKIARNTKTRN